MEFHSQIIQYRELSLIYDQVHTDLPLKYQKFPGSFNHSSEESLNSDILLAHSSESQNRNLYLNVHKLLIGTAK
jgi:hypothetical protein